MKVAVLGLWHLGSVTAACLADAGFDVVGIDDNADVIRDLNNGQPALFEPGLGELVVKGIKSRKLDFTTDFAAVTNCDLVWVTYDTPVDDDDVADVAWVIERIERLFVHLKENSVVLISSQLQAGTTKMVAEEFSQRCSGRKVHFAYSPENLRLGQAIKVFTQPGRIIIGTFDAQPRALLETVLGKFCDTLLWMSVTSAEMVKHGLNAFLATCVTFANELATICELVGANAIDVERGLRSDPRIGRSAYIRPGGAFAGGTLARDVSFLNHLASDRGGKIPLLGAILGSNAEHRVWPFRQICSRLKPKDGPVVVLGLSYKPGTDAIRRSSAIELCRSLLSANYNVRAVDPVVRTLPPDLAEQIEIKSSALDVLQGAAVAVVATEWPEFLALQKADISRFMSRPLIIDPTCFLARNLDTDGIEYITVGRG